MGTSSITVSISDASTRTQNPAYRPWTMRSAPATTSRHYDLPDERNCQRSLRTPWSSRFGEPVETVITTRHRKILKEWA